VTEVDAQIANYDAEMLTVIGTDGNAGGVTYNSRRSQLGQMNGDDGSCSNGFREVDFEGLQGQRFIRRG